MNGDPGPADADAQAETGPEEVLVTSGDVTSIGDGAGGADAVATGSAEIAASLTTDPDMLNIAFVTGGGDVQFLQISVDDLIPHGATASDGDVVVNAELTALSADAISSGRGAATPVGSVSVAAHLDPQGDLSLSFVDGEDHLQLIETNVAQLLQSLGAAGGTASAADPGDAEPGR
jgi:hypothetical protein